MKLLEDAVLTRLVLWVQWCELIGMNNYLSKLDLFEFDYLRNVWISDRLTIDQSYLISKDGCIRQIEQYD